MPYRRRQLRASASARSSGASEELSQAQRPFPLEVRPATRPHSRLSGLQRRAQSQRRRESSHRTVHCAGHRGRDLSAAGEKSCWIPKINMKRLELRSLS